jgi:hypothetical protein
MVLGTHDIVDELLVAITVVVVSTTVDDVGEVKKGRKEVLKSVTLAPLLDVERQMPV